MPDRIGFIGLGIMGAPMVRNLLGAGFEVVAWNRSAGRLDAAVEAGAERGKSPANVAGRTDVVISCVTASADVEAVALGEGGVIEGIRPGSLYIDMSTIAPSVTRDVSRAFEERGAQMLDAPVSGGEQGAIAGTLSIMVGGPADALERARPAFEAMGKTITHCGPIGAGQTVKLCNQIAVVLNNLAMAEALVFCERSGVDPSVMLVGDHAGRGGFVAALEPRAEGRGARLRAGLQGRAAAEGPAPRPRGRGRAACAASGHIAGAPAVRGGRVCPRGGCRNAGARTVARGACRAGGRARIGRREGLSRVGLRSRLVLRAGYRLGDCLGGVARFVGGLLLD